MDTSLRTKNLIANWYFGIGACAILVGFFAASSQRYAVTLTHSGNAWHTFVLRKNGEVRFLTWQSQQDDDADWQSIGDFDVSVLVGNTRLIGVGELIL